MEKMASRKEKRKAARQKKKQHKHQYLLHYQKKFSKSKRNSENLMMGGLRNSSSVNDGMVSLVENVRSTEGKGGKVSMMESDSDRDIAKPAVKSKMPKRHQIKVSGKRTRTGFEEYLEMDMKFGPSMEEDLEMERMLAKKLKKKGKLDDGGDGLDFLLEGIPSFHDLSENTQDDSETEGLVEGDKNRKKKKKKMKKWERDFGLDKNDSNDIQTKKSISSKSGERDEANGNSETEIESTEKENSKRRKKKRKKLEEESGSEDGDDASDMKQAKNLSFDSGEEGEETTVLEPHTGLQGIGKYVAPHLRSKSGDDMQEYVQIRRRVRGLLNRMSESNVESITGEIFSIFQSVSRAVASQVISEEVLASCAGGPRGNEQNRACEHKATQLSNTILKDTHVY